MDAVTKEPSMSIDPTTTAVVLIEYQNDFATDGGVLHGAVSEVMEKTDMLENTKRVVEKAREDLGDTLVKRVGKNVRPVGKL